MYRQQLRLFVWAMAALVCMAMLMFTQKVSASLHFRGQYHQMMRFNPEPRGIVLEDEELWKRLLLVDRIPEKEEIPEVWMYGWMLSKYSDTISGIFACLAMICSFRAIKYERQWKIHKKAIGKDAIARSGHKLGKTIKAGSVLVIAAVLGITSLLAGACFSIGAVVMLWGPDELERQVETGRIVWSHPSDWIDLPAALLCGFMVFLSLSLVFLVPLCAKWGVSLHLFPGIGWMSRSLSEVAREQIHSPEQGAEV